MNVSAQFTSGESVQVETVYFGLINAQVVGFYPNATPPYVNLWLTSGYAGAFYTTTPDKVHKIGAMVQP